MDEQWDALQHIRFFELARLQILFRCKPSFSSRNTTSLTKSYNIVDDFSKWNNQPSFNRLGSQAVSFHEMDILWSLRTLGSTACHFFSRGILNQMCLRLIHRELSKSSNNAFEMASNQYSIICCERSCKTSSFNYKNTYISIEVIWQT